MPHLDTPSLLRLTAGFVSLELSLFAGLLWRRGLFHWTSAGFWAWASFVLFFVLSPVAVTFNEMAIHQTQIRLALAGGIERGMWILLVILLGMAAFFTVYLRTSYQPVTWRLPPGTVSLNLSNLAILGVFIVFGMYSLIVFRAGLSPGGDQALIIGGRFIGETTGYQYTGYIFLFVPVMLFLLSRNRWLQATGGVIAIAFVILSLPHAWLRFTTVSFLLAISMITVVKKNKRWPDPMLLMLIVLSAAVFQLRGHTEWHLNDVINETIELIQELPERSHQVLSSSDTAMLQAWYVLSYWNDEWIGYDYGLPLVNYALSGWIPSRLFPQKYFIIDWLYAQRSKAYPLIIDFFRIGVKSTLLGGFYAHGGLIAVLLGAMLAGSLSRRLDGMLDGNSSNLVKSIALSWLSTLWMVWASDDFWGLMTLGTLALPGLAIWLISPKLRSEKSYPIHYTPLDSRPGIVHPGSIHASDSQP
jgi:hypothetical protein